MIKNILVGVMIICAQLSIAQENNVIRIITSQTEHSSIAGLYPEHCKKFNLQVKVEQKPASAYDVASGGFILLERGDVDIISATLPAAIIARSNKLDIYTIVNLTTDGTNLIVNDKIKSYKDLKGKTIGQLKGSSTFVQFERKLKEVGLSLKDVNLQFMTLQQMPIAFERGIIDGYVGAYPFTLQSMSAGGKAIDNFPDVVRQLYASSALPESKVSAFKACHIDLYKTLNDFSKKPYIDSLVSNAKANGIAVNLPANTVYAYKLTPSISTRVMDEIVQFLKSENKLSASFILPPDFNRTQ